MKLQPTIILKYNHSSAIAFEGKAACDFIKLLDGASLMTHEYKSGTGYQWVPSDPDSLEKPELVFLPVGVEASAESASIRTRLAEAKAKLERHWDLIAAAEQLDPEES
jgi:hypothetical protein